MDVGTEREREARALPLFTNLNASTLSFHTELSFLAEKGVP